MPTSGRSIWTTSCSTTDLRPFRRAVSRSTKTVAVTGKTGTAPVTPATPVAPALPGTSVTPRFAEERVCRDVFPGVCLRLFPCFPLVCVTLLREDGLHSGNPVENPSAFPGNPVENPSAFPLLSARLRYLCPHKRMEVFVVEERRRGLDASIEKKPAALF